MIRQYLYIILLTLFSMTAQSQHWNLVKQKEGVQVYKRPYKSTNHKEVKGVTKAKVSLEALIAVIKDSEGAKEWVQRAKVFKTIKEISKNEWITYTEISLPFPYANRDLVTLNSIIKEKDNAVTIFINSKPQEAQERTGIIRIQKAEGFWSFKPLASGETEITYQFYSEPDLNLPSWIKDPIITAGIIDTLNGLVAQTQKSKYGN